MAEKSADAFRTISEVAEWLGTPTHVLRFWESKFAQVKPVKRAGGRRYYRPADMQLLGGIKKLLHEDGMTIKGVQKLLRENGVRYVGAMSQPLDDDLERILAPLTPGQEDKLMVGAPDAPKDHAALPPASGKPADGFGGSEDADLGGGAEDSGEGERRSLLPFSARSASGTPRQGTPDVDAPEEEDTLRGLNPAADGPSAEAPENRAASEPLPEIPPHRTPDPALSAAVKSGVGVSGVSQPDLSSLDADPEPSLETAAATPEETAPAPTAPETAPSDGAMPGFMRSDRAHAAHDAQEAGAEPEIDASPLAPDPAPPAEPPAAEPDLFAQSAAETPPPAAETPPARPAGGRRLSLSAGPLEAPASEEPVAEATPTAAPPVPSATVDAPSGPTADHILKLIADHDGPTPPVIALAPVVARLAALRDRMVRASER